MKSRREFIKEAAFGASGWAAGMDARILGANDRLNFAIIYQAGADTSLQNKRPPAN